MNKYCIYLVAAVVFAESVHAQNMSWMQTARMQEKGSAQLIPMAMGFDDRGVFRPGWGLNYGMQFTYGVSDKLNLTVRNTPYTYFFVDDQISFAYLGAETKINLKRISYQFCFLLELIFPNISVYSRM